MSFIRHSQAPATQFYVENGTPLDRYASELGFIEVSLDRFPGVPIVPAPFSAEVPSELARHKD